MDTYYKRIIKQKFVEMYISIKNIKGGKTSNAET